MELKFYPNSILRKETEKVITIDDDIKSLVANLYNVMRKYGGIGLAAPQIGVSKKVAVVEVDGKSITLINPEIVKADNTSVKVEGCLSFPTVNISHIRPEYIKVKSLDLNGKEVEYEAEGLAARAIDHEIDHLKNVLFIDYLSNLKKDVIKRKMIKFSKRYGVWKIL